MLIKGVLNKSDTVFFKGIAILMIVFHNYFHSKEGYGIENEQSFNSENIFNFINYLKTYDVETWIYALFAFLGHYGVQIFIFLSAYGLTVQYQQKKESALRFILLRLRKIYYLLFFGILFCIIFEWYIGNPYSLYDILKKSFLLGTSMSSFTEWYLYAMFAGPFWFFALVIQLYVLFPLLYHITCRFTEKNIWILFIITYGMIYLLYYILLSSHFTILGNVFGHLPEVFLGISMAHFKVVNFSRLTIVLAAILFVGSQFFEFLFPISFLAATIVLFSTIKFLQKILSAKIRGFVHFVGVISMILFIVNGRFRWLPFFGEISILHALVYIPILFLLSYLIYKMYEFGQKKLKI